MAKNNSGKVKIKSWEIFITVVSVNRLAKFPNKKSAKNCTENTFQEFSETKGELKYIRNTEGAKQLEELSLNLAHHERTFAGYFPEFHSRET